MIEQSSKPSANSLEYHVMLFPIERCIYGQTQCLESILLLISAYVLLPPHKISNENVGQDTISVTRRMARSLR